MYSDFSTKKKSNAVCCRITEKSSAIGKSSYEIIIIHVMKLTVMNITYSSMDHVAFCVMSSTSFRRCVQKAGLVHVKKRLFYKVIMWLTDNVS